MAGKKVAVVTGGMGGLGESITTKMADAGYRVVVTYSPSNTKYKSWLGQMSSRRYSISAFPGDVVEHDDCACKCSTIPGGGRSIQIALNQTCITRDKTFNRMRTCDMG